MHKAIKAEKYFLLGFALLSLGLAVAVFAMSQSASAAGLRDRLARAELYSDPFSPPSDRVVNGSFESGVSTPDAWTPCPDAAAWDNTTTAHDGTHSARVTTCAWQSDGIQYLSSGTWYIGYWHKEDSSVQWVGASVVCGGVSQTVGAPAFGDSQWHYYNRYIILDSACDSNLPRIRLTGSTDAAGAEAGPAGSVWYDQVSLGEFIGGIGDIVQPPSVDWMAPVGNQQTLVAACATTPQLPLLISATTYASLNSTGLEFPRKLDHVDFWRFDVATQKYYFIATVNFAGDVENMASTTLDVCSLPTTESDITADVFDHAAGNTELTGHWAFQFIRVFGGTPVWLPLIER